MIANYVSCPGIVHIRGITRCFLKNPNEFFKEGNREKKRIYSHMHERDMAQGKNCRRDLMSTNHSGNCTISLATFRDLDKILVLQRIAYQSEAALIGDYTIPPLTQTICEIQDEFGHTRFLKAEIENRIVGSVRAEVQEGTCFVKRLIVHPDFQNRGIGSSLLTAIEQDYLLVERYELFTGKESKSNHIFYTSRGYCPFKEEHVNEKLTFVYYEKMNLSG